MIKVTKGGVTGIPATVLLQIHKNRELSVHHNSIKTLFYEPSVMNEAQNIHLKFLG